MTVVLGGMRLVSWYQPIWGSDEIGMERSRREVETQLGIAQWAEGLQAFKREKLNSNYLKNHNKLIKYT